MFMMDGSSQAALSTIFVISGGQFSRTGSPIVPIPRETYILDVP
jgi:hypothetical protein